MEYINIYSIESAHFAKCWQIYESSFPQCERRDLDRHCVALNDLNYRFVAVVEGGGVVAVVGYWLFGEDMLFVEHLAVSSDLRSGGYGGRIMDYIESMRPLTILEIELPIDELSTRRRGFYEGQGLFVNPYKHKQPPYREGEGWLPLVIMSYPRRLSQMEYETFRLAQLAIV